MKKDSKKSPFFAKFLEKQISSTESVNGGTQSVATNKKSDQILVTMKYPSDRDEMTFSNYDEAGY